MMNTNTNRRTRSPDHLLTVKDLADLLSVPADTIYRWRYVGTGPTAIKVGRHLRFRIQDVEAWLDERAS